ncbi:MAG: cation transporting ATPase C-terminal domain-containing protein, partial [Bacillota bacterium]
AAAAVYFGAMARGADAAQVRAATFACLVLGNLSLIVASRSAGHSLLELIRIPNAAQWGVLAGAALARAAAVNVPAVRGRFHLSVPGGGGGGGRGGARWGPPPPAALTWFEVVKRLYRKSAGRA